MKQKADYDCSRRAALGEKLRAEKRAYYYATHADRLKKQSEIRARIYSDPAVLEMHRAKMKSLRERPEWKAHKALYDRRFRATKLVGPDWADAYLNLLDLESEVEKMVPDRTEMYIQKGTYNKAQTRKRKYYACRREN